MCTWLSKPKVIWKPVTILFLDPNMWSLKLGGEIKATLGANIQMNQTQLRTLFQSYLSNCKANKGFRTRTLLFGLSIIFDRCIFYSCIYELVWGFFLLTRKPLGCKNSCYDYAYKLVKFNLMTRVNSLVF